MYRVRDFKHPKHESYTVEGTLAARTWQAPSGRYLPSYVVKEKLRKKFRIPSCNLFFLEAGRRGFVF